MTKTATNKAKSSSKLVPHQLDLYRQNIISVVCSKVFRKWVLCLLFCLVEIPAVQARIRHYKWEVKYEYKSPDRVKEPVITINGGTPGPTILAHQRDTVVIELKNSLLTETVAIHWQRLTQTGTPWSDGTEGVSLLANKFVLSVKFQSQVIQRKGRLGDGSRLATPSLEPGVCNTARPECSPYAVTVVLAKTYGLKVNALTALSALSLQIEMVVYSRHIFPTCHACKYRLTTPFLTVSTGQMDAKRWWQVATPWMLIKGWWFLGGR